MAVELVGGALLSPDVLAYLRRKTKRGDHVDKLLGKLTLVLNSVAAVLEDAERKQISNPRVEKWLDMLQEGFYDADDLSDEIETDVMQLKVEAESTASSSKVRKSKKERYLTSFLNLVLQKNAYSNWMIKISWKRSRRFLRGWKILRMKRTFSI